MHISEAQHLQCLYLVICGNFEEKGVFSFKEKENEKKSGNKFCRFFKWCQLAQLLFFEFFFHLNWQNLHITKFGKIFFCPKFKYIKIIIIFFWGGGQKMSDFHD